MLKFQCGGEIRIHLSATWKSLENLLIFYFHIMFITGLDHLE